MFVCLALFSNIIVWYSGHNSVIPVDRMMSIGMLLVGESNMEIICKEGMGDSIIG